MSALRGNSDAQRAQLETERRRGEELTRDLHAARAEGEQRVELVRGEAMTHVQRSQLALTAAAARCAGLEQQVANLQQRDVELSEVRMELQRTGSALAEARESG